MHTSPRSVSPEIASVPPVASSDSSQSVSSKNASHLALVQVLEGHEDCVRCACFYPDEGKLVSGSEDETLRIWDRKTGASQVLSGHTGVVWDVDVSQDGKMVVSGSGDKTVRIWNGESGETMHLFEGHEEVVRSVKFSPDSSTVVSGSEDRTVRVWLVETGELVFKPIECYGRVFCVGYSPSGDRIVSGADSIQIWNAETGVGILSIRDSSIFSLAWTADGTHIIGGGYAKVTIWNSHDGDQLRTWKAHDRWIELSLSPTAPHLATSSWEQKIAYVFDITTGEQVATLKHDKYVKGIVYSPSGQLVGTAGEDKKLYLWKAPAFKDPQMKSPARSFSSFLNRPAIPQLAGPSRSDARGLDPFWDSLPNRDRRTSPQSQRVLNKARNTFANIFTRRQAGAAQTSPVRETVEPVEVAAGRDKTFWVVVAIPTYNAVERILYMIIHCRKPEDPDDDLPAATGTNSSETTTGNAAPGNQSEPAGDLGIRTQPQRTEMPAVLGLSGVGNPDRRPESSQTQAGKTVTSNQPERIEMVAFPPAIPQTSPVSPPSHTPRPTSLQASPQHDHSPLHAVALSPIEIAMIEEYRRRQATSAFVETASEPLSSPAHDRDDPRSP